MASKTGFSDDDSVIADINVTPFVDVVLVLLIIFMITAPVIYRSAIQVQLPKAQTGEQREKKTPYQFTVTQNDELYWDENKLSWSEAESRLKSMKDQTLQSTALISADQKASHGSVIRLIDLLRKYGLTRFALDVDGRPREQAKR